MARRALTAIALAGALAACSKDDGSEGPPRFAAARVDRIPRLESAVEVRSRWQPASRDLPEAGLPARFARGFESESESWTWSPPPAVTGATPPTAPRVDPAAAAGGATGIRFETAEGALVWWLPARPETSLVVSCAVRRGVEPVPRTDETADAAEARARVGRLLVVELERSAPGTRLPSQPLAALERLLGPSIAEHRAPAPARVNELERVRLAFETTATTASVVIVLSAGSAGWWRPEDAAPPSPAPAGAVDFDDLAVHELPLARTLVARSADAAPAASWIAWRRALPVAGDLRPAIVAVPPTEIRIPLELPAGAFRLRFAYGVAEERRESSGVEPIRFFARLEADGANVEIPLPRPIVRLADGAADAGWHECRYDGSSAGGAAVLTLATTVESGHPSEDVALFTEPEVIVAAGGLPRRNILLVSIDTLRADRLGAYGYRRADGRPTTPNLDALARESVVFTQARALAPYTLPSHATLLTGMHPAVHGVERYDSAARPDVHPFLADRFAQSGWHAVAFTGGGFLEPEHGLWHGFERWTSLDPWQPESDPNHQYRPRRGDLAWNQEMWRRCDAAAVRAWVRERRDEPFFAFVHTYVVHNFRLPPPLLAPFLTRTPRNTFRPIVDNDERTPTDAEMAELREIYDATIAEADRQLGDLIQELRASGVLDRTIVVVTSDHGEELGDHGGFGHGRTLYDEVLRVPLIVRVPGVAPRSEDAPVTLADVAPTLLALAGLEPLPNGCGRVLVPALAEATEPVAAALNEIHCGTQRALVLNDRKLIEVERMSPIRPPLPIVSLFDLGRDRAEQSDLLQRAPDGSPLPGAQQPPELRPLAERLADLFARYAAQRAELKVDEGAPSVSNPDLDALGYARGR